MKEKETLEETKDSIKFYQQKIKELKEEIKKYNIYLKAAQSRLSSNLNKISCAEAFQEERNKTWTAAEIKFAEVLKVKGLHLKKEYKIEVWKNKRLSTFYFADFCDIVHKVIFEVDGEYHNTPEQQKKDTKRTKDLESLGYRIFRISNEDVLNGKTTEFLYNVYKSLRITVKSLNY